MTGSVIVDTVGAGILPAGVGAAASLAYNLLAMTADELSARKYGAVRLAVRIASFIVPGLIVGKFLFSQAANARPLLAVAGLTVGAVAGAGLSGLIIFSATLLIPGLQGRMVHVLR